MATLITKTCANCGRKFITRDRNKIYCDIKCEEYARDGIAVEIKEETEKKKPRREKVCLYCGQVFVQKQFESNKTFESRKCCCGSCGQKYRMLKEKANR